MKKFLLLLLLASGLYAQTPLYLFDSPIKGNAVSQNGSNQYEYVTPALRMTGAYALRDDFSDGNYNGWTVSSGAYAVDTLTNPLSSNRYNLKCTTAGIISIPMNQAYGVWEFDVYKGADGNTLDYYFMCDITNPLPGTRGNGYQIRIGTDESISIIRRTTGNGGDMLKTSSSYIANSTYYKLRIRRNTNGSTFTEIKGGAFGSDYVTVSATGGSGTNPFVDNTHTVGNYAVGDLDAGDRISNIVYEYGEGSLDLNSFERVLHSDNRGFEATTALTWAGKGNHSSAQSNTDKKTGTYSLAITSSAAGDATNCDTLPSSAFTPLVAGEKYTIEGWARGTGILGSDLLSGWDFTSGWTASNATITGANTFTINSASGYITKGYATTGKYYKIRLAGTITGAGALRVTDGSLATIYVNPQTGAFDVTSYFTAQNALLVLISNSTLGATITTFTVEELTRPSITLSIGGQSKTISPISCVPSTFTKLVWNFQATANEVNQPIKIYANQADVIYLDDFSVTQAWDALVSVWASTTSTSSEYTLFIGSSSVYISLDVNNSGAGKARGLASDGTNISSTATSSTIYNNGNYYLRNLILDRTENQQLLIGSESPSASMASVGKLTFTSLIIGRGATSFYWSGLIGEVLITKFKDIAQSNVSANSLLSAYKNGLVKWVGGIPVFNSKWKGTSLTQAGYDYSGAGNHLTFVNVTIADIIFGQGYFIK